MNLNDLENSERILIAFKYYDLYSTANDSEKGEKLTIKQDKLNIEIKKSKLKRNLKKGIF